MSRKPNTESFDRLVEEGRTMVQKLERTYACFERGEDLLPENARVRYSQINSWYQASEGVIAAVFGTDSAESQRWTELAEKASEFVDMALRCHKSTAQGVVSGAINHLNHLVALLLELSAKIQATSGGALRRSPLTKLLARFRECCQYLKHPPSCEPDVQDILWIMLRSHFDRVVREEVLPKFGIKSYRPDFGLPDLAMLVEVKFIGEKTQPSAIQEQVLADVSGYLAKSSQYQSFVVFVYDAAHRLRDPTKFIEDLRSVDGIADVVVVPGMGGGRGSN